MKPVEATSWVDGWLDFVGNNTDNTNTAILKDPNKSKFAKYLQAVGVGEKVQTRRKDGLR